MDLAFLPPDDGYVGFICMIDVYSRFVWTEKIKSKKNDHLIECMKKLFKRSKPFRVIHGDGEMENIRKALDDMSIHLQTKARGQHVK